MANGDDPDKERNPAKGSTQIEGALASSLTSRQALIDQHSCFILATNELDGQQLSPRHSSTATKARVMLSVGSVF